MSAFWIILTGSVIACSCALLGCFLVLRRLALVGDAVSHAVLPGIVIAFLLSGSREPFSMLLGAGALGLLTTLSIEFLQRTGRLQSDASIGLTFTALFALGVVLLNAFAGNVDLDQDCVLYGEIAYTPIDRWITASGWDLGPRAVWIAMPILVLVLLFVLLGYKELKLTTFDAGFATAVGLATAGWHYALMSMVSLVTVASFESVGAILVVALLVVPAATAQLLTQRLSHMLVLSCMFAVASTVGGYALAVWLDGSIAGAMATVAGLLFVLAVLVRNQPHLRQVV